LLKGREKGGDCLIEIGGTRSQVLNICFDGEGRGKGANMFRAISPKKASKNRKEGSFCGKLL